MKRGDLLKEFLPPEPEQVAIVRGGVHRGAYRAGWAARQALGATIAAAVERRNIRGLTHPLYAR